MHRLPWSITSLHRYIITERLRASTTANRVIITATIVNGVDMIANGVGIITGIIVIIATTIAKLAI